MKKKTIFYAMLVLALLGRSDFGNTQLVTKHLGVEPEPIAGFSRSELIWLPDHKPLSYSDHVVTKFTTNGDGILFNKAYDLNGSLVTSYFGVESIGYTLVYNTNNHIFATDNQGNPLWAKDPSNDNGTAQINSICESSSGNVLLFQAKEKYGLTYLTVAELSINNGNLLNYHEYLLNIPTNVNNGSFIRTATIVSGYGYFLTLKSSTSDSYTITMDFNLSNLPVVKQQVYIDLLGTPKPLHFQEILKTDNGEMFFINNMLDGGPSSQNGVHIGKLNFSHDVLVLKYVESADGNIFDDQIEERGRIVETENTVWVNLPVEGDGTISTKLDGVTYCIRYFDGNILRAGLLQYDVNFNYQSQFYSYDFGTTLPGVDDCNIVKSYNQEIHMRVGESNNPSYNGGFDNCFYNVLQPEDLSNNCHAEPLEIEERDVDRGKINIDINYSTCEYWITDMDLNHTNLSHESDNDCEEGLRSSNTNNNQLITSNNEVSIYPNPSSESVFIDTKDVEVTSIDIYTISGKRMETTISNNGYTLQVSQLTPGVYIFKIHLENNSTEVRKVIIE